VWSSRYNQQPATKGASCVTGSDGSCTLTAAPNNDGAQFSAFIDAGVRRRRHPASRP